MAIDTITATSSGIIFAGPCLIHSILEGGTDGSNDVTVTVYDNPSAASGNELIPTHVIDASALGLNGVALYKSKEAKTGVYVEITTAGTAKIVFDIGQP